MTLTRQGEVSKKPQGEALSFMRPTPVSSLAPQHPLDRLRVRQQTVGNQGVLGRLQVKLAINQPGDAYEQEADRVADAIMSNPTPGSAEAIPTVQGSASAAIQRKCAQCDEEPENVQVQRKESSAAQPAAVPAIVGRVLNSHGQPLDRNTRSFMESRFDHDFSDVRVHTDAQAGESARAIDARAYTVGRDVVFGQRRYAPDTSEGKHLLAHELAHVVQQRRSACDPAESPGTESDASAAARNVAAGGQATVSQSAAVGVAREKEDDTPLWKKILNPLYNKAREVLPTPVAAKLEQANEMARGLVEHYGVTDEQLNKVVAQAAPLVEPANAILDAVKAAPKSPPTSVIPTATSPEGLTMTQDQIDALEDDKLFAHMKSTLEWLRTHKQSPKQVEQVAHFYVALSTAYSKREMKLAVRRADFDQKRDIDQQLRDSAARRNLREELAPSFAFTSEPIQFPSEVMEGLSNRDEEFHDDLVPPRIGEGKGKWRSLDATVPEADLYYSLDNFTGFSYDALSKTYILKFPDGAEAKIPRQVVDDPKLEATLAKSGIDSGIQGFKTKESKAAGIRVPARINAGTLPKLYATIQDNQQDIQNADAFAFVGRNVLTHEDIPGADTIDKITFGLWFLRTGVRPGVAVAEMLRRRFGGGPKPPLPSTKPPEMMSKADLDRMLKGAASRGPANDIDLPPEPLARTGTDDFFFPQANSQPQLRLVPDAAPGINPFNIPWKAPEASTGRDGLGPGGVKWTLPPRTDISGTLLGFGGTWSAQARRTQTATAKQEALQSQIDAEIDRINNRRGEITAEEWRDQRAGLTKHLYNLREQHHALQITKAEPGAVVLTQVKVLGVNKGGTFTATKDITSSGEGRIPDIGLLKTTKGKLTLIDSKTENELIQSIAKRGTPRFKDSSNINKQIAKENELKAFGGDWVLQGTDPITNEKVWFTMSSSEVENSRPVPYYQYNQ